MCGFNHCRYLVWLKVWGWEDAEREAGEGNADLLVQLKNTKGTGAIANQSQGCILERPLAAARNAVCSKQ